MLGKGAEKKYVKHYIFLSRAYIFFKMKRLLCFFGF